ncbi:Methionyl-tRNA synthetase [Giardia duodenalis]|uniref:methionine--tRNA ligase n=1 Tax=Giardia intestinalis (strain ATCC 50803 / WB clone C6) TaxID=184922 RepID=A8BY75_GIAIC|nr:Methionyl-tRNA synthetase [Giardia intestinalis]KAE8301287.1 Methionyl-tRNA synthetase [Giardia intestinalis]|eukprot:XP_001704224.1 Methionyl-tRNA synthetase [Giardia lamblia ATCC 50803]
MEARKVYLTTPIYYVNGKPHIGHVFTTLLADTLKRFRKLQGFETYLMTGTDEHGQKVQQSAEKMGLQPQQWCDNMAKTFETYFLENFGLCPDVFMRTTMPKHVEMATKLWEKLRTAGLIYKDKYEGWYCVADEAFVTETNLKDGVDAQGKPCKVSAESGQPCVFLSEENYKFRLSSFQEPLLKFYQDNPEIIIPAFRQAEIVSFIHSGLHDISISRSKDKISWGIPVPGDSDHVMYVWIDALAIYLTAADSTINPDGTFSSRLWPADVQFLGKDIARFHCVYWLAFLMGASIPCPRRFFIHGWWTINHQKIGKSLGNALDPMSLVEAYGLDGVKYFMLREGSPANDPGITEELISMRTESDLANVLGNLTMRCTADSLLPDRAWTDPSKLFEGVSFAQIRSLWMKSRRSSIAELLPADAGERENISSIIKINDISDLLDKGLAICEEVTNLMDNIDIPGALSKIFEILVGINNYIQLTMPWVLIKKAETKNGHEFVMYCANELLRVCATLLLPFIPQKAPLILDQLGVSSEDRVIKREVLTIGYIAPGLTLGEKLPPLFPKQSSKKQGTAPAQGKAKNGKKK